MGLKVGIYPMVGDLLHTGHIYALREAKSKCDRLIVLLNCVPDNKKPVESIFERYSRLESNKYVDYIIPYEGENDLLNIIKTLPHDIRFVGADYIGKDYTGREFEMNNNVETIYLKRNHDYSSTNLKSIIKERG
jgi:glycerol-3-phosphate cytidylyltransferase